jgi:diacylglycerol kinase (ATP)
MKTTLMYNLTAGNGSFNPEGAVSVLKGLDVEVQAFDTKEEGFEDGLKGACDLIIIAGGDGTVEKILRRLVTQGVDIPVGILPCGSANNLARSLGLQGEISVILDAFNGGRLKRLSIGEFSNGIERRIFFESAGWGIFSDLLKNKQTSSKIQKEEKKENKDKSAKAVERLLELIRLAIPKAFTFILDGKIKSGEYYWVEVMNSPLMGPSLHLAPEASPEDIFLDVFLIENGEEGMLRQFLEMNLLGIPFTPEQTIKVKELWVKCDLDPHLDDEVFLSPSRSEWSKLSLLKRSVRIIDTKVAEE